MVGPSQVASTQRRHLPAGPNDAPRSPPETGSGVAAGANGGSTRGRGIRPGALPARADVASGVQGWGAGSTSPAWLGLTRKALARGGPPRGGLTPSRMERPDDGHGASQPPPWPVLEAYSSWVR